MGASLVAAEALHYYAFFAFVPIGLAEIVFLARTRHFRWAVWIALALGFVPLLVFWPILEQLKGFYGTHYWISTTLLHMANAYALFFKTFAPIALAMVVVFSLIALRSSFPDDSDAFDERWLLIGLLILPLVAFFAMKLAGAGFVERYVLVTALGIPLGSAYMLRFVGRKAVPLFAIFVLIVITLQEGFFWMGESRAFGRFVTPANSMERLADSPAAPKNLPIVVSDGHDYLQIAHYASPAWASRVVAVVDPPQAVVYSGSDSLDKQLFALQCCLSIQVYEFQDFARAHPRFLLYSGGREWDWWPYRFLHDGYSLQLIAAEGNERLYLVSEAPPPK